MKKPIWIKWINKSSGGYIDEFPVELFEAEGTRTILTYIAFLTPISLQSTPIT